MCLLTRLSLLPAITTLSKYQPSCWPTASPRISGHIFKAFNFSLLKKVTKVCLCGFLSVIYPNQFWYWHLGNRWLVICILPTLCENETSRNSSFVVFELEKLVWWWMHNSARNEGITCTFITCQSLILSNDREMCVKINEILFCQLKLLTSKWARTRPMLYTSLMISDVQLTQFYM